MPKHTKSQAIDENVILEENSNQSDEVIQSTKKRKKNEPESTKDFSSEDLAKCWSSYKKISAKTFPEDVQTSFLKKEWNSIKLDHLRDIKSCCAHFCTYFKKKIFENECTHYALKSKLIDFYEDNHTLIFKLVTPFIFTKKTSASVKNLSNTLNPNFELKYCNLSCQHLSDEEIKQHIELAFFSRLNEDKPPTLAGKCTVISQDEGRVFSLITSVQMEFKEKFTLGDETFFSTLKLCRLPDYFSQKLTANQVKKKTSTSISQVAEQLNSDLKVNLEKLTKDLKVSNQKCQDQLVEIKQLKEQVTTLKEQLASSEGFRGAFADQKLQNNVLTILEKAEQIQNAIRRETKTKEIYLEWHDGKSVKLSPNELPERSRKSSKKPITALLFLLVDHFKVLTKGKLYSMPADTQKYEQERKKVDEKWISSFITNMQVTISSAAKEDSEKLRKRVAEALHEWNNQQKKYRKVLNGDAPHDNGDALHDSGNVLHGDDGDDEGAEMVDE